MPLNWLRIARRQSRRVNPLTAPERLEDRSVPSATLVKDLNTATTSSDPSPPVELDGKFYFFADDGIHGAELWVSDGSQFELVKDINPGPAGSSWGYDLTLAGNRLFFTADDGVHGQELWTSDGTADGTHLVKEINPTSSSEQNSLGWFVPPIQGLTALGDGVVFLADDGVHGQELWTSDGTADGTHIVKEINPGTGSLAAPTNSSGVMYHNMLTKVGEQVYFTADDGVHGTELWVSDGTAAGTQMVQNLNPGAGSFPYFGGSVGERLLINAMTGPDFEFTSLLTDGSADGSTTTTLYAAGASATINGKIVFAGSSDSGTELWVDDGSPDGPRLLKEINPSSEIGYAESSDPGSFVQLGDVLYFTARTSGPAQFELWKTDGTEEGTEFVTNLGGADAPFVSPPILRALGDGLVAYGSTADGWKLWASDGTAEGTQELAHLADSAYGTSIGRAEVVGDRLFLLVDSTGTGDSGTIRSAALWVSDGTAAGTELVRDFVSTPSPMGWSIVTPHSSFAVGDTWLFTVDDGEHGTEWWTSDGTLAGTQLAADINNASADSSPENFVTIGDHVYFTAKQTNGRPGLWKSDGTTAGTTLVADLPADPSNWYGPKPPRDLQEFDGELHFVYAGQLWRGGAPIAGDSNEVVIGAAVSGGNLFYFSFGDGASGLWKTDGTTTERVRSFELSGLFPLFGPAVDVGGTLFFVANDDVHGPELWKSDGTAAGTVLVNDINPNTVDYVLYDGETQEETNRTFGYGSNIQNLTPLGGSVVFFADDGVHGPELWVSDGTADGTMLVKDIWPGERGGAIGMDGPLVVANGLVFFTATDGEHGYEPWVSDGTAEGTFMLRDIQPATESTGDDILDFLGLAGSSFAGLFTPHGDQVFFTAYDQTHGIELWKTDGTPEGTVLVKDIFPGGGTLADFDDLSNIRSSIPHGYVSIGDTLYFLAADPERGTELWQTDGTAEGTRLAFESVPGPESAFGAGLDFVGSPLAAVNGVILFAASDGIHGRELWVWTDDGDDSTGGLIGHVHRLANRDLEVPYPMPIVIDDGEFHTTEDDGSPPQSTVDRPDESDDESDDESIDESDDPKPTIYLPDQDPTPPTDPVITGGAMVSAGTRYRVTEGGTIQFHAEVIGRTDGVMLRYAWDLDGDGEFDDARGASPTMVGDQLRALRLFGSPDAYTIRVRVTERDGTEVGIGTATLMVADAPLVMTGHEFEVTEGQRFNRNLVTFKDRGGFEDLSSYSAVIHWADGTTSAGTVIRDGSQFRVAGEHTFARAGTYSVVVSLIEDGAAPQQVTATITVHDAGLFADRTFERATAGQEFTAALASFRDRNTLGNPAEFHATIDWGDGQTTDGTIAANSRGGYDVIGQHIYAAAGSFLVRVTIHDEEAKTEVVSLVEVAPPKMTMTHSGVTNPTGLDLSMM